MMMALHLPGLPHTVTTEEYSHCAFTEKVLKFAKMFARHQPEYRVVHYGVEGAETEAAEQVDIMSRDEQNELRGHDGNDPAKFYSDDGNTGSPLYLEFNRRLNELLRERVADEDLVLMPFGAGHSQGVDGIPAMQLVESGIGYLHLAHAAHKVFESEAWRHWHQGRADRNGLNYEWVIPNYYDEEAWDVELSPPRNRVVFLGRICEIKGLDTIWEIARRRRDLKFELCGQGDPGPWLQDAPNIRYVPPISGRQRSAYLGNARAIIVPTLFTEPFGGVAAEAQMCGTPAITTDYGAFTETVENGKTGFRCKTLGDFLAALDRAPELDRAYIAERARSRYGLEPVSMLYDRAFRQIIGLRGDGWNSLESDYWKGARHAG